MNAREIATLIGVGLLAVAALVLAPKEMLALLKSMLAWKIWLPLVSFIGWLAAACFVASRLGVWDFRLFGGTVLWILLVGLPWCLTAASDGHRPEFFKSRLYTMIGATAAYEFFVNLEVMPIFAEIVLLCVVVPVAVLDAYSRSKEEFLPVARLTGGVLIAFGLGLVAWTVARLAAGWSDLVASEIAADFLLPLWLALWSVPFLYAFALLAAYESLVLHLRVWNDRVRPSWLAVLGVALELRGSLKRIAEFRGPGVEVAASATSIGGGRGAARAFRQQMN